MDNKIVPREIFQPLLHHLKEEEITIILGARQVGKTTLLRELKEHLQANNIARPEEIQMLNLDLMSDLELLSSQKNFIRFLQAKRVDNRRLYIFVDEVQRLESPGTFFKGIYDLRWPVKFVLTGSSSLEIKAKVQEPLTGRKRIFTVHPFSFREFIQDPALSKALDQKEWDSHHLNLLLEKLYEYLVYGGYPRVAVEPRLDQKYQILQEIYSSYIEKDIAGLLKIRRSLQFSRLVSLLASQVGQLVNVAEISNTLDLKQKTIHGYLRALEQTFVCGLVRPFFRNIRKELTKMPKIYFWDNGLRNLPLEAFRSFEQREDRGNLLENFVFSYLMRKTPNRVRYWRTKDKSEVDFVLEHPQGDIVPIEVKAQILKRPELPRSLVNFIRRYKPRRAILVNLGLSKIIKTGQTSVHFVYPFAVPYN